MTFLNPLFLLGTMLAVVPILIHLWFRKRLKKIPFSTLQFLKKTEARRFGWLKLREYLILALRCLFVLFLFLSLAKPQLKRDLFQIGRLASVFLIIDDSYSMAYGNNLENMKDIAQQVISRYSSNSEFCIAPLCKLGADLFWTTKTSALSRLQKARLAYRAGNIGMVLAVVPSRAPKYAVDYVYVGDGQSSNFKDLPAGFAENTELFWVRIPTGGNIGISNVVLKDPVAVPTDKYTLTVTVSSYSARTWSGKIGVTGGNYYDEKECNLKPGAGIEVDFFLPTTVSTGTVEIFEDSLVIDNVYYFDKYLPRRMNVLLVGDSPYLLRALTAGNGSNSPFNVVTSADIGNRDLRGYDILVLDGPQEISEVDKIKMIDHLADPNAALVLTLGGEVGENLRDFLSEWCRVGKSIMPRGYITVDWIDNEHPVFRIFEGNGALKDVQYFRYQKLEAENGVLARFAGGDPFIIVRGNLAVVTGSLNAQQTNFVYKNSFVPIMLRLLVSLASQAQEKEFFVGDRVLPYGSIRAPNGELLNRGDEFTVPGFHFINGETLCVNVESGEGNLKTLGTERADVLNVTLVDPTTHLMGSDLTNFFLVLALLALVSELALLLLR